MAVWREIEGNVFGTCIKNCKDSPDKCVPISRKCDHGVYLAGYDCMECDAAYNQQLRTSDDVKGYGYASMLGGMRCS